MIVHHLDGCAPTPLAHYLKALGIVRVVAEQLDPKARGWWEGERFLLASEKEEGELLDFFIDIYKPTALFSPWNAGSGFFSTWDASRKAFRSNKNGAALQKILAQENPRWDGFKKIYSTTLGVLSKVLKQVDVDAQPAKLRQRLLIVPEGDGPIFPVADKDSDKKKIQRAMAIMCSSNLFFRSAIVDVGEKFEYPSLFGSGGNDGNIDFTGRHFENLVDIFFGNGNVSLLLLRSAMYGYTTQGLSSGSSGKAGQFLPGGAGGANSTTGPGTQDDTLLNPWDYVLMLEGAILFAAASTRRLLNTQGGARAAAPFAVGAQGAGYASAAASDEGARGEQWMPLWSQPITCAELQRLLAEGRAQLNAKAVTEPLDLARAVVRLGVARGITAFERYGYIERNGQSNLAVPLGRFRVPDRIAPALACLDDLDAWLVRLRREARGDKVPARFALAERCLADALFALIQHPDEAPRWQLVLQRLADIEAIQIHGVGIKAGPIPRLRARWLEAADDGSAEFRLAAAFALQCGDASHPAYDGLRRHWLTLSKGRFKTTGTGGSQRLAPDTDRVMQGRSGEVDALAVLSRRLVEAAQRGERRLPLEPDFDVSASRHDLARLLAGEVDIDRCLRLARALMALDRQDLAVHRARLTPATPADWPDDAWLAIRLALLPWPLPDGRHAGIDPAIVRRLEAGDAASAVTIAIRRLRAGDIPCAVRVAATTPELARRYAMALAFPISRRAAAQFAQRLSPFANQEYAA